MSFIELCLRFVAGGFLVVAVSLIAHSGNTRIAGIVMLFPAITLVSFLFLNPLTQESVKQLAIGGLIAIPCTVGFLLTIFFLVDHTSIGASIGFGIVCWLAIAMMIAALQAHFAG